MAALPRSTGARPAPVPTPPCEKKEVLAGGAVVLLVLVWPAVVVVAVLVVLFAAGAREKKAEVDDWFAVVWACTVGVGVGVGVGWTGAAREKKPVVDWGMLAAETNGFDGETVNGRVEVGATGC